MSETEDLRNFLNRAKAEEPAFYISSLENAVAMLMEKVERLSIENQDMKRGELVLDEDHLKFFEEVYLSEPESFSEEKIASYLLIHDERMRIAYEELLVYGYLRKPAKEAQLRIVTIPNEKKMKLLSALKKHLADHSA